MGESQFELLIKEKCGLEEDIADLKEENSKLFSALMSMTMQYLQIYDPSDDPVFSHDFMSAGEETLALLVELGIMVEVKPSYFKLVKKDEEK